MEKELLELIDKSPTAFHVIENAKGILDKAGYKSLKESEVWNLQAGEKYYVSRNDSSMIEQNPQLKRLIRTLPNRKCLFHFSPQ